MPKSDIHRPTSATIDLDNLSINLLSAKKFIGENLRYMAIVKADAYGHGAVPCARHLEKAGIDWFGVALPEEGLELRANGILKPILCLGGFWHGQEKLLIDNNLTPVIYQIENAGRLNRTALNQGVTINVHLKIDTGMGRIGVRFDEIEDFAEKLLEFKHLNVEGVMTHFAAADDLSEFTFTNLQIHRFNKAVGILENKGFRFTYKDLANSPGAIIHPSSRDSMVRLGGILYGLGNDILPSEINKPDFKPVLSLHTQIAHLKRVPKGETVGYSRTYKTRKDSIVATIPIGYYDGLPRTLSNTFKVLVNGFFASVIGRISMDWTMIDVTHIPNVNLEDKVVIIGENNNLCISAEDIAQLADTISYEITCGISKRVARIYVGA